MDRKREDDQAVLKALLLQQHRSILFTSLTLAVSSRILFLMILLFGTTIDLNLPRLAAVGAGSILLSLVWLLHQRSLNYRSRMVEEVLVHGLGLEDVQDLYIRASHKIRDSYRMRRFFMIQKFEPILWGQLTLITLVAAYFFL